MRVRPTPLCHCAPFTEAGAASASPAVVAGADDKTPLQSSAPAAVKPRAKRARKRTGKPAAAKAKKEKGEEEVKTSAATKVKAEGKQAAAAADNDGDDANDGDGYDALRVADLKALLKAQGLSVGGRKPALIARLREGLTAPVQPVPVSPVAEPVADAVDSEGAAAVGCNDGVSSAASGEKSAAGGECASTKEEEEEVKTDATTKTKTANAKTKTKTPKTKATKAKAKAKNAVAAAAAQADDDADDADDDDADNYDGLRVPELKALLKARGLGLGGGKAALIKRLREGVPVHPVPAEETVTYDWDSGTAVGRYYKTSIATSGRSKCIRCLSAVEQGSLRVNFTTMGDYGGPIDRSYHSVCFGAFPPRGLDSFEAVKWHGGVDPEHRAAVCECFKAMVTGPRATAPALGGLRQLHDELKVLTGTQGSVLVNETANMAAAMIAAARTA